MIGKKIVLNKEAKTFTEVEPEVTDYVNPSVILDRDASLVRAVALVLVTTLLAK